MQLHLESVSIRPAAPGDLPDIVRMRNALNALELSGCAHASIQKLTLDEFTALWGPTLDDPNHCWRIVEQEGRPIGFGLIYLLPKTKPLGSFIHWAYLEQDLRGQGLGQRLLDHLLDWARTKGAARVELQYIDNNHSAERFWTKSGFQAYARKCVRYL